MNALDAKIERARQAQIEHDKRVPVQLTLPQPTLWASYEEWEEEFRRITFKVPA